MKKILAFLAVASIIGFSENSSAKQTRGLTEKNKIIVHMKHFTDDLHTAYMALELADRLQCHGAKVTFLFDLEGVRFADGESGSARIRGPGERSFSEIFDAFIKGGGQGLVCHHCAEHSGIKKDQIRKGVESASMDKIAEAILAADKIVEY